MIQRTDENYQSKTQERNGNSSPEFYVLWDKGWGYVCFIVDFLNAVLKIKVLKFET